MAVTTNVGDFIDRHKNQRLSARDPDSVGIAMFIKRFDSQAMGWGVPLIARQ